MRRPRLRARDRTHALRVATVATVLVVALYVIGALVLDALVVARLTHEVDARLADRLSSLSADPGLLRSKLPLPESGRPGGDIDDAPSFLWTIGPGGRPRSLSVGAPALPRRSWGTGAVSVPVHGTTFRFEARTIAGLTVVAGQSEAEIVRVRSAFVVPEVVFGAVLLVAVFLGALVIGLRASAPLEAVRRRQAEFAADASHELRTPLSVIEAEVSLALRESPENRDSAVLQRVAAEGRRLRHVVDDLLWLARNDGVPERRGSAVCDLGAVASACAGRFGAVSEARGVRLEVGTADRGPFLVAAAAEDVDRLTGVLVDNACRYAGPAGRVQVRVRGTGGRVVLEVDDSGPGIAEDELPFIFDRFHRSTESPGGTGLGLAIADAVVRATRGSWNLGRSPLGGAHFGVSWRRAPRRTTGFDRTASPGHAPGTAPGAPPVAGDPLEASPKHS